MSDAGGKGEARKRFLTREEIIQLFQVMRDKAVWYLPKDRTKTETAIDIPLSAFAVETLRELQTLSCASSYLSREEDANPDDSALERGDARRSPSQTHHSVNE
jgi:hypothetical protein